MNLQQLPHRIVSLVTWNSQIVGLVLDAPGILLISASPPGYYSKLVQEYEDIAIYKPKPCIPGTQQINRSFGPCVICPPGSKNDGSTGDMCVKCTTNDTLRCFGAAINETDMTNITSYDQAKPYPDSPHTTEFGDLLLQNVFKFMITKPSCLLISPIFWAYVAIGSGIIVYIMIKIFSCRLKTKKPQRFLKKILSHCDVIGKGKHWLSGLVSLSLLVLIIFSWKFSISFSYLYPIEEASSNERFDVSCDDSLFNAKLASSLQLLSTLKHEDEKPIFDLLDEQEITMIVQFISTGYRCEDVTVQQIRDRGLNTPFSDFYCSETNKILTISKLLPYHIIALQLTLTGPHFVGGLRLCFSAPSATNLSTRSTIQQMDTCKLFFIPNQILTRNPTLGVKMTKVINQTAGLTVSNATNHTGLWLPSFMVDTLTDELFFSLDTEYLRYVLNETTLIVVITESDFYMKNTQEPIARHYEIAFNTILFTSKILIVISRSNDRIFSHPNAIFE
ncbi:unnamed protein product [Rotaria sp. Silwood2]|nr:unnamed protein product [Rotaria sp. Silwood2]CAF4152092.1 unnamed protein product [Rotaria sp. Silwood2]